MNHEFVSVYGNHGWAPAVMHVSCCLLRDRDCLLADASSAPILTPCLGASTSWSRCSISRTSNAFKRSGRRIQRHTSSSFARNLSPRTPLTVLTWRRLRSHGGCVRLPPQCRPIGTRGSRRRTLIWPSLSSPVFGNSPGGSFIVPPAFTTSGGSATISSNPLCPAWILCRAGRCADHTPWVRSKRQTSSEFCRLHKLLVRYVLANIIGWHGLLEHPPLQSRSLYERPTHQPWLRAPLGCRLPDTAHGQADRKKCDPDSWPKCVPNL